MRILVTGATGFLGGRLVARLAPRHALRLLVRPTARRTGFPAGVEFSEGDVTDRGSVDRAVAGCDALIHAAALVKILAPAEQFDRVNVEGTRNVLAAADAAGIERQVYVSSFMALGPTERGPGHLLDETAPAADRLWINDYERTKTLADRMARERIAAGSPLRVVYPGVVYGPGEMTEGNIVVRSVLDLVHRRIPALVGNLDLPWSYVHVEDVVSGIVRALETAPAGARYALGGDNVPLRGFYGLVEELSGVRVPRSTIPTGLAKLVGAGMKGWARLTGGVPQLTPDLVEVCTHAWGLDSSRAARELGYAPRTLRDGLASTFDWLRESGEWRA